MVVIENKNKCCGCRACEQKCPVNCIEMKRNAEGFMYPQVCETACIGCNACKNVCPVIISAMHENEMTECEIKAYGGWNKDEVVRINSSSGGAFSLFAEKIISSGGKVFGCSLDEENRAIHIGADTLDALQALRGSKYVQSDTANTYNEVKESLKEGRMVLFVGTPCQAAGLYSFLGKKAYKNLYIVDFICHGVPSPQVFADYINKLERKNRSRIVAYKFRNKDKGWSQTGLQLGTFYKYQDGTEVRKYPAFCDKYMNAFLDDIVLRPSCYECCFKSLPKVYADFTIGDFWGVDKINPELNDKKGTSLILVNTPKGKKFWDEVSEGFEYKEVDLEKAIRKNPTLLKSAKRLSRRDKFFADYQDKGYDYVEKKYMSAITWGRHKAMTMAKPLCDKLGQFIKFGIVGCSNTLINLAVYYLCLYLGINYIIAYTLGFLVSVCNAFYWNNKYVFKNKQEKSLVRAFIKVFASYGFSFVLSLVMMSLMVEILNISFVIAPVLKLVVTIPINFLLNKVWAFKDTK